MNLKTKVKVGQIWVRNSNLSEIEIIGREGKYAKVYSWSGHKIIKIRLTRLDGMANNVRGYTLVREVK